MNKKNHVQMIQTAFLAVCLVFSLSVHSLSLLGCDIHESDPKQVHIEERLKDAADQKLSFDEFESAVKESQKIAQRKEFLTRITDLFVQEGSWEYLPDLVNEKQFERQRESLDILEHRLYNSLQSLQKDPVSFFHNSDQTVCNAQTEKEKGNGFCLFKKFQGIETEIQEYSLQKKKLNSLKRSSQDFLHQLKYRKMEMEKEILELDERQRELFEKNQKFISEQTAERLLKEPGWNHEAMIDSNADLPDIGSAREGSLFGQACLSMEGFRELADWKDEGLLLPAQGILSAGTWNYPSGGLHLGMDLALPVGTPLQAPCDGIILYADDPVESNCGYLGNWCGWPYGGGNTICMLGAANGKLYAFSFFHLSKGISVYPGMNVRAGDILARSGNSGNSSGPHTHIEVFEIYCSRQEAIAYFAGSADFSFGTGWQTPGGSSELARRIRAEKLFGIG